ncbi:MAG TPA: DUF3096 domain-containing protein [Candidatus Nanoarchaeia archaeon]|nr:DUF3096 domain-containing protein [Candidatus Nanoarchaeia archaeon]
MSIGILGPVASLIFGVLVLMFPRLLNNLVGIYLIIIGLIGVLAQFLL